MTDQPNIVRACPNGLGIHGIEAGCDAARTQLALSLPGLIKETRALSDPSGYIKRGHHRRGALESLRGFLEMWAYLKKMVREMPPHVVSVAEPTAQIAREVIAKHGGEPVNPAGGSAK